MDHFKKAIVSDRAGITIVDFLADETSLSKSRIKQVMSIGGVWMMRDGEPVRIHRAKHGVTFNDEIHIYYDESLLSIEPELLLPVADHKFYSVWEKPAGIWAEQSLYCDHLSLERAIARSVPVERDCYWAYPEAAEIGGLLIISHTRAVAAKFERMTEQADIVMDLINLHRNAGSIELADGTLAEPSIVEDQACFFEAQGLEDIILENILEQELLMPVNHGLLCARLAFTCPVTCEPQQFTLKKTPE